MPEENLDQRKGERIRFMRGTYKGQFGWKDTKEGETKKQVYVILEDGKTTRVNKTSVQTLPDVDNEPDTFEEAILQQVPKVNELMTELALELSKIKGVSY